MLFRMGSRCLKVITFFVIHNKRVTICILIYIDDLIITGSDKTLIHHVSYPYFYKKKGKSLKYLCLLQYFLGVEVHNMLKGCFSVN